ncbi:MAG: hypothetical protein QW631_03655 [Candidatus Aenigmatarchaeota archaeon]
MKEIIEKIEKSHRIELAISIYDRLESSLEHIENTIIALISISTIFYAILEKILMIESYLTMYITISLFLILMIERYHCYWKTEKLLRKLKNIILEDPMEEWIKDALRDSFYLILLTIFALIVMLLIAFS